MENSCYGCTKRKVGCHSTCERYKEWLKDYKEQMKIAKSKERKFYDFFYE